MAAMETVGTRVKICFQLLSYDILKGVGDIKQHKHSSLYLTLRHLSFHCFTIRKYTNARKGYLETKIFSDEETEA